DRALLDRVRALRDHGRTSKYLHHEVGFGERLDALQAAVLRVKLKHLEDWTMARRRWAALYNELLSDLPVIIPKVAPGRVHVYHLYVIRVPGKRDDMLHFLKTRGLGAGIHYPVPVHRQPAYMDDGN